MIYNEREKERERENAVKTKMFLKNLHDSGFFPEVINLHFLLRIIFVRYFFFFQIHIRDNIQYEKFSLFLSALTED